MMVNSHFKPAWWLKNNHAQTLYRTLTNTISAPIDLEERLELPDGDFIDLAWMVKGRSQDTPLIILLHGLGGSINSAYIASLFHTFNDLDYRVLMMNFRGANGIPNRLPRSYHAGETTDLDFLLNELALREPESKKAVIGISLGGNVLLKWLGERSSQSLIHAAVAVSVPFELNNIVQKINKGFSRVYQNYLLNSLKHVFLAKIDIINHQIPLSKETLISLKTLYDFDQYITAPLHGFANAEDYYRKSSSKQYLKNISTPVLIIHSLDDPFMTPQAIPNKRELSSDIVFELSRFGGHVGFITSRTLNNSICWLDQRIPQFFKELF